MPRNYKKKNMVRGEPQRPDMSLRGQIWTSEAPGAGQTDKWTNG